jgi:hypothetical protein
VVRTALAVLGGAALGAGIAYGLVLTRRRGLLGQVPGGTDPGIHLRQIRRYAFASSQDLSPIVGLTHASYALVLLDTLEEVAGREAVARSGINAKKMREFITKLQDKHAESLNKCDPHLQKVLAIERREGKQIPGFVVAGAYTAPMGA